VLGPITLGDSSRVGSNAVVVKDVPAGATVVGIPGHIVAMKDDKAENKETKREAMAKKIGFDAYGASKDMPDPIQNALDTMLDHMLKVEKEMDELKKQLNEKK
jgi:serine O-acetyltransferase